MVAQAVPLFWCGLSTRLRWTEVYAVYRLCWGYWYAAAVRHMVGLSDAGMLVVRLGRRGVGVAGMLQCKRKKRYAVLGAFVGVLVLGVAYYAWLGPFLASRR
jgi:hypothetical protein